MLSRVARIKRSNRLDEWEVGADCLALLVWIWPIREAQAARGDVAGLVFIGLSIGVVLLRRWWPVHAMAAALVFAVIAPLVTSVLPVWLAAHVCLLSLALRRPLRLALAAAAALFFVIFVSGVVQLDISWFSLEILGLFTFAAAVTAIGAAVRSQRRYVALLEEAAMRLRQTRDSEVRRRVTEERLRIARDLHDAVAHSITVINLHAGSAQANLGRSEEATRASLQHISAAARLVLTEMQQILQVLRTDGTAAANVKGAGVRQVVSEGPVIGLHGVYDLVESFRAAGLTIQLRDTTTTGALGPVADATLYRVIQEGLTNAHRHGAGPVELDITESEPFTHIRMTNTRAETERTQPHAGGSAESTGYGLVGMRERVSQARGQLEVIMTSTLFTLVAELPHDAVATQVAGSGTDTT